MKLKKLHSFSFYDYDIITPEKKVQKYLCINHMNGKNKICEYSYKKDNWDFHNKGFLKITHWMPLLDSIK